MKRWFIIFSILCWHSSWSQDKEPCQMFWNNAKSMLDSANPNYEYVLKQLAAYKVCEPASAKAADDKIIEVYRRIKEQKDQAVDAQKKATATVAFED